MKNSKTENSEGQPENLRRSFPPKVVRSLSGLHPLRPHVMRDAKRVHLRLSLVRTIQEYLGVFFYGLSVALLLGVLTVLLFGDSGTDTIRVNAHQTTPSKSVSSKKSVNDGQGSGGNGGGEECEEWIGMISKPFRDMRSRQLDLKPMFTSQMGQ
eukprot:1390150-Amorphochlora_amoeboformis.AAC.2